MELRCKMCDGVIPTGEYTGVATCPFCQSVQTVPKLKEQKIAELYERAERYRHNNEFDKALALYEEIVKEDPYDAEWHWALLLCKFGVEYVEDTTSKKRIPTVNRACLTSVYDDPDYKNAQHYGNAEQQEIFTAEAAVMEEIQKGILEISEKEEPFDIFICYKETDENGRRALDSVLAMDLYESLWAEGYNVFFSRVTLKDKIGTAYEPYIFAALQSARVMIVLGTKPAHFEAVWVRNEWSRFLGLIKQDKTRLLIPAYKNMNPYDMPKAFSHLQGLDMSKLGFKQDLIAAIKRVVKPGMKGKFAGIESRIRLSGNEAGFIERGFMLLEEEEWKKARITFANALRISPKNPKSNLGMFLATAGYHNREEFLMYYDGTVANEFAAFLLKEGDDEVRACLEKYADIIGEYIEDLQAAGADRDDSIDKAVAGRNSGAEKKPRYKLTGVMDMKELGKQLGTTDADIYAFYKEMMTSDHKEKVEVAYKFFANLAHKNTDAFRNAEYCRKRMQELELEECQKSRIDEIERRIVEKL